MNAKGWSDLSEFNVDGFRIQSEPYFMNVPERNVLTNTQEIFVTWQGISEPENGNSEVTSYSLEYDAGTNGQSFQALVGYLSDYLGQSYSVTEHITRGENFQFRLRAKNMWGWGVYSEVITILAARRPLPPS